MKKMWQEGGEAPFDDISDAKGDEIQKLSVIQTLPSLLAGDPQSCIQRLMPKMQQTLPTASTEFHVAASSTFKTILEQRLVSHSTFTQTFLQSILNSLDSRDQIVAHAWLETLLDVIELLPADVIGREILPVAINKGQLSQPVNSRITCCKLLGKICTRFESQMIKKDVLPTVHSLCQDVNSEVRACICVQLHYVAEGLGPESVKSSLLPSIVELANDEESIVRHASVQTIVYLLPHLQADIIKSTISPLIKKSCENALKSDDTVILCVIAQEFGKIAIGLDNSLSPQDKVWLLKYFQQLAQVGINNSTSKNDNTNNTKQEFPTVNTTNSTAVEHYVECRRLCAFNIPAMFIFASSTAEDVDILLPTFSDLAGDPFYRVRRAIACGFHEVTKILGPKNHLIKNEFIKLLKDDNEDVLQGLIQHVAQTLELFVQSKTIGTEHTIQDTAVRELGRALLKCEGEIFKTNNWRLSKSMLEQLEILPKCFPSDYIYTYFVPVTFNRALNARPMPVRLAAGRTLLVFIRYNLRPLQRTELRNRIYSEFARSPSCYVRMLFLRMMIEAMAIFSSNYFKEHFYSIVLSLSDDLIANIRLKLVTLLPMLKSYLRLPSDKKLLSSFESTIRNLMNNEKDRDVIFALSNAIHKLDEIEVRHEGQTSSAKLSKQDHEDLKRYEEEKKLAAMTAGKQAATIGQLASALKKGLTGVGGSGRTNTNVSEGTTSQSSSNKQTTVADNLSKSSSISTSQKAKQTGVSEPVTETTFKASRQANTSSRNFDPSKASTARDNLTSSWARLTSSRMLLTHLWEKIDQPDSIITNTSFNTICKSVEDNDDFISNTTHNCGCRSISASSSSSFIYPSPLSSPSNLEPDTKGLNLTNSTTTTTTTSCSCHHSLESSSNNKLKDHFLYKHNYFDTSVLTSPLRLTHTKENRHDDLHSYFLPRDNTYDDTNTPNFAALRAVTNAAQYNSCWAFSSMPEIPVTLLDDEFLVDTGVRIPAQLSSSQSTSKIPNLQDIIYRNTRIGNVNKSSSRWSIIGSGTSTSSTTTTTSASNYDKGKSKLHYSMHENCMKRSTTVDRKSNRLSLNSDDPRLQSKMQLADHLKDKMYTVLRGKPSRLSDTSSSTSSQSKITDDKVKRSSYINNESSQSRMITDDKIKRSSFILDRDKKSSVGQRDIGDKFKRYSASYNYKLPDSKDSKQKFKRHSLEVTDYTPMERGGRLKRNFTLDVNHNQGSSKIPLRNSAASGSRTAPVTRASSPIRLGPQLSFDTDHHYQHQHHHHHHHQQQQQQHQQHHHESTDYSGDRSLTKFSSSDEEVDKLCIRFAYVDSAYVKDDYPRKGISKLPVWIPRKKS